MKKITAPTLQEAISNAALELACSVTEIDYEVIQYDSQGMLGLFKKPAIIIASCKSHLTQTNTTSPSINPSSHTTQASSNQKASSSAPIYEAHEALDAPQDAITNTPRAQQHEEFFDAREFFPDDASSTTKQDTSSYRNTISDTPSPTHHKSHYHNTHRAPNIHTLEQDLAHSTRTLQTKEEILAEITAELNSMFSYLPYKINTIQADFFDTQTITIYLDGEDSALLIGERGYRYKALSYLLFNWIQPAYGYNIRLEIAQFLQHQEEAIQAYLIGIMNEVRREGKAQTKPLDGVLAFIALKKLREEFPDKYIAFRETPHNERYIIINDFYR